MNAKVKKGIGLGVNIVIWIFLVFAIVMTVMVLVANATRGTGLPSLFGRATVNVVSNSMSTTFEEGDMLVVRTDLTDHQRNNLKVGDIISFYFEKDGDGVADDINTHRIIEVIGDGSEYSTTYYRTQGDNIETNPDPDPDLVPYARVLGVYESKHLSIEGTKATGLGAVLAFFQTSTGFLIFVVIPMAAFFVYELINFILIIVRMRKAKVAETLALSEEEIKKRAIEEFLREQEAKKLAEGTPAADTQTPAIDPFAQTESEIAEQPAEDVAEDQPQEIAAEQVEEKADEMSAVESSVAQEVQPEVSEPAPVAKPAAKTTAAKKTTTKSATKSTATKSATAKKTTGAAVRSSGKKSTTKSTLPGMSKTTRKPAAKKSDKKDD